MGVNIVGSRSGCRWRHDGFDDTENGFIDAGCQMIHVGNDVTLVLPHLVECQQGLFQGNADQLRIRADHGPQHGDAAEKHIIHVLLLTHGDGVLDRNGRRKGFHLFYEDGPVFSGQARVEHIRDGRLEKGLGIFSMNVERNDKDAGPGLCRCNGRGNQGRTRHQQTDAHYCRQNVFFHLV